MNNKMTTNDYQLKTNQRIVTGVSFVMEGSKVIGTIEEGLPMLPSEFPKNRRAHHLSKIDTSYADITNVKVARRRIHIQRKHNRNTKKLVEFYHSQIKECDKQIAISNASIEVSNTWSNLPECFTKLHKNTSIYLHKNRKKIQDLFIEKTREAALYEEAMPYYEYHYAKIKRDFVEENEECPVCMEKKELIYNTHSNGETVCSHGVCADCCNGLVEAQVVGSTKTLSNKKRAINWVKCPMCRVSMGGGWRSDVCEIIKKKEETPPMTPTIRPISEAERIGDAMANLGSTIPR